MANPVSESGTPTLKSSSALIRTGAGQMLGIFCSSTTSGTVVIYDALTATNAISGTIALTAGTWYPFPANFTTGLYIAIANTASITVFWNPTA